MKIKYLLSGRLFSDINNFRKLIDSWPDNIKFPEVVEDIKNIKLEDTVITMGYLGQSAELIKEHDPNKVFILDNSIYPSKGIKNFRLLNGNLQTLYKNDPIKEQLNKGYYKKYLLEKLSEFDLNNKASYQNNKNNDKNIIEFPWSIPLEKLIHLKNKKAIDLYNNQISLMKNKYTFQKFYKNGAIQEITKKHIPLLRVKKKKRVDIKTILDCECICCPTSTMALNALIIKKRLIMSQYNPFYNYLKLNDSYKNFEKHQLIETLITYIGNLNFSISELFKYIYS